MMNKPEIPKIEIGELAGKMWRYLSSNGRTNLVKLKIDLGIDNSRVFIACGWLARENKVTIERVNGDFFVSLATPETETK